MKILHSDPISFTCGIKVNNRFMLAPLTNTQSHSDGTLSEDEYRWLIMRAKGGFGITMTCASHIHKTGQGFPGQLGIYSDHHIEGHRRLVQGIKEHGSIAVIQLHHAGMRSPGKLIGEAPVCPSDNAEFSARGMTLEEVKELRDDFVAAAVRAKKSGYDGVEVHGAHGYIITQFLSSEINKRTDEYGGTLENRSRLLFEIVDSIREQCGPEFLLGVRLSPERVGMKLSEVKVVAGRLCEEARIDFLDMSLWDVFKLPEEEEHRDQTLLEHFTNIRRGNVRLTVAGNIRSGYDVKKVLEADVDFITIGRAAILHHDFPEKVMNDPEFRPIATPVTKDYLRNEGLGEQFIQYMKGRDGFVKE